jgi:divalent metal cation (Fe/Co/Zn/Cd) transporter
VVNAQGQKMSIESNPSELAKNLISAKQVDKESIIIDPDTHRVPALSAPRIGSGVAYAVGAMTRGQIIDASMAHGICLSIEKVVKDLLGTLERRR